MSVEKNSPSVEGMIKDLKEGAAASLRAEMAGELVTRDDGSQALRVRKRKRRSSQPAKEAEMKHRKRKIIWIASVFGLGFLVMLVGVFSLAYHNSNAYQEKLAKLLSKSAGVEAKIEGLRVSVLTASAKSVQMQWSQGGVDHLELASLTAEHGIGGFFGGKWDVPEVSSQQGTMVLRSTDNPAVPLSSENKSNMKVGSFRCSKLDVYWDGDKKPWLKNLQISYVPEEAGDKFSVLNGYFGGRQYEDFRISNGVMRTHQDAAEVGLYLDHERSSGSVILEGNIPYDRSKVAELAMQIIRLPFGEIAGDDFGHLIEGSMDSEHGSLWLNRGKEELVTLQAELSSEVMSLSGFSFLTDLSALFNKQWYNRPVFDDGGKMHVKRSGEMVSITGLELEAKGELKIIGEIHTDAAGNLKGKLKVGVPLALKSIVRMKVQPTAFVEASGGYLWQEVILGGTIKAPEDKMHLIIPTTSSEGENGEVRKITPKTHDSPAEGKKSKEEIFEDLTE